MLIGRHADALLIGAAQGITPGTPVRISAPNDKTVPTP